MNLSEAIIWAKTEGLSVVEIGKAISWKAGTIHDLLRDNGVISHVERRNRQLQLPQIDDMIISALKTQKLSFERWVKGWGWDLEEAITQLSRPVNCQCQLSVAIHCALNRDLPYEYFKTYEKEVASFKSPAYPRKIDHHSYTIEWDPNLQKYKCKVVGRENELDAPVGTDCKPDLALANLQQALKQERQVKTLQKAVAMLADYCQKSVQEPLENDEIKGEICS